MKFLRYLLVSLVIIFFGINSYAQNFWEYCYFDRPTSIVLRPNGDIFAFVTYTLATRLYISTDGGNNWSITDGYPVYNLAFANNGYIYGSMEVMGVYYSTDNGYNWTNIGLANLSAGRVVVNSNGDLFVSATGGIYRSTDNGTNWTITTFSYKGLLGINSEGILFAGNDQGMYRSTDNGDTWEMINVNLLYTNIKSIFIDLNNDIYVGTASGIIFKSSDNGDNWLVISSNTTHDITSIVTNSVGYIFVSTKSYLGYSDGILRSTDGGNSWSSVNSGLYNLENWTLINRNDILFVGGWVGIYKSTQVTTPVELNSFAGFIQNGEVVLNWSTSSETNNHGFEIQRKSESTNWVTIGFKEGKGTTAEPQSYSFIDEDLQPEKYSYRLKQVDFNGTYYYSNVVDVEKGPSGFSLSQNYPNPFNPITSIQYTVGSKQLVTLKAYDVLGNEVSTLVNEEKTAGSYTVKFDGSTLSSGIYLYQMKVGDFTAAKKLILLK